ncbi:hypothetical protein K439DRAFT_457405 [Ramaria rubella]|nr:hypothetical protein K439DRAFT_457405 [Ramaria rubella]
MLPRGSWNWLPRLDLFSPHVPPQIANRPKIVDIHPYLQVINWQESSCKSQQRLSFGHHSEPGDSHACRYRTLIQVPHPPPLIPAHILSLRKIASFDSHYICLTHRSHVTEYDNAARQIHIFVRRHGSGNFSAQLVEFSSIGSGHETGSHRMYILFSFYIKHLFMFLVNFLVFVVHEISPGPQTVSLLYSHLTSPLPSPGPSLHSFS